MTHETLMWLLPVVFMIHDFEEIIMMKPWLASNRELLLQRFPFAARYIRHMDGLSPSSFSMMVALEFLIISLITFLSVRYDWYYLWMALFMVFTLHLFVHIVQFLIFRRYIPVIITSLAALFYCIPVLFIIFQNGIDFFRIFVWTLIMLIFAISFFILIQKLALKFEKLISKKDIP